MKHQENSSITGNTRSFQRQRITTNITKPYESVQSSPYESVQRYQDSAQKGYYKKNYEKHSNHNASNHAQTNYSKSQKFKEPPKETCTLIVKTLTVREMSSFRSVNSRSIKSKQ
ncbi:hypothetical protein TNCV_484901 [Trichonephila clavipes]|nr:hypothetical protein TNCV_484901 [Trichonephila clavipes]